ncbi:uncharacterized protein LOC110837686 [Zootermopsis nevadensis]|uniref:uncharacterized protein LOC110837686 n=1 Tax=Zootermopsis nevadensis TaxID=136037 RepID=UPI000B8E2831|nr:uncharacterized protein LOC110837686 [Zootermopsis nevadensis]
MRLDLECADGCVPVSGWSKALEGPKGTMLWLAFNLGVVSAVLALLDMSLCSFYLPSFEDFNKQTFRLQTQVSYSVLNEAVHLLYVSQGIVGCLQSAVCALLFYKSARTSADLRWFAAWLFLFTVVIVSYLRVLNAASLFQEPVPVVNVLAKGLLSSVLNVYFLLASLCMYHQHSHQDIQPIGIML